MDTSSDQFLVYRHMSLDETDRQCVAALQTQPRATWRELGALAGVPEKTLARRIKRLIDLRLLRIVAELDPIVTGQGAVMHAWITCRIGTLTAVAEKIAMLPHAQVVVSVAGKADVMAEFNLGGHADLATTVLKLLPSIDGVDHVESRLVLRAFRRAGQWRFRAASQEALQIPASIQPNRLGDGERRIIARLAMDGRATMRDLAETAGVSEPTAQRLLQGLTEDGLLSFRIEIEPALLGFPVEALVSIQAAPGATDTLAQDLARDPHTRCLFGTSGSSQLFWHVLCSDSLNLWELTTRRLGETKGVINSEVGIVIKAHKRCGIYREGVVLESGSPLP